MISQNKKNFWSQIKTFYKFYKHSILDLKNKLGKMYQTQPLSFQYWFKANLAVSYFFYFEDMLNFEFKACNNCFLKTSKLCTVDSTLTQVCYFAENILVLSEFIIIDVTHFGNTTCNFYKFLFLTYTVGRLVCTKCWQWCHNFFKSCCQRNHVYKE